MAKPDRPVRLEYYGVVRDGVQFLEMRITTPRGQLVNSWAIGQLPPVEESEKRSGAQERYARAALCIEQRKDIAHALATGRAHLSGVRYIRAVEALIPDIKSARAEALEALEAVEAEPVQKAR